MPREKSTQLREGHPFLCFFLFHPIAACQRGENAERGEERADKQGGVKATHKRILQAIDVCCGQVVRLWR